MERQEAVLEDAALLADCISAGVREPFCEAHSTQRLSCSAV